MERRKGSTDLLVSDPRQPSRLYCFYLATEVRAYGSDEEDLGQSSDDFRPLRTPSFQFRQNLLSQRTEPTFLSPFKVEHRGENRNQRITRTGFKFRSSAHEACDCSLASHTERLVRAGLSGLEAPSKAFKRHFGSTSSFILPPRNVRPSIASSNVPIIRLYFFGFLSRVRQPD